MSCYNEDQLFDFINKELPSEEMKLIEKHLQNCLTCKDFYHQKLEEVNSVMKNIPEFELSDTDIPAFSFPETLKKRSLITIKPYILRISIAATLLILISLSILFVKQKQQHNIDLQLLIQQEMLISDMNEAWHNRELVITQTDDKNNTTKVFLSSDVN